MGGSRNNRQVSAEVDSAIFPELQSLLLKTVGPKPILETCLSEVAGIESAFIYGSWARRYEGEAGAPPGTLIFLSSGRRRSTRSTTWQRRLQPSSAVR